MTSVPHVGHLVPMFGLGRALQDSGHEVRVATHSDRHGLIADAGLVPVAAGISAAEMSEERARRWPETVNQPVSFWAVRMFTQILAPTMLADLGALIEAWRPDLVVHEEGEYAAPVAAARAGTPWVTHAWGSPLRPTSELISLEEHAAGLWASVGLDVMTWSGLYHSGLVNPCPAALQPSAPGASTVLPVRPETHPGPTSDTNQFVDAEAYVGFGTVPAFADDVTNLVAAARSCTSRGLRTLVTTTTTDIARQLIDQCGDRAAVRTFVSLPHLLATCSVVVCHGGAGTVLAALSAGVPLVVVRKRSPSQIRMAEACARAGVGVAADANPGSIDAGVELVLEAPTYRQRAQVVAREIKAMPEPAAVVPALQAIA
jgi:UDP:flavonoid glycosyltransferase YjiC (YdhE family)